MRWMKLVVFLLPLTMAAACDDSTGTGNTGQARVYMTATGNSGAAVMMSLSADYTDGMMGQVSLDNVDSLYVRLTGIKLLRMSDDTAESSNWVTIQLADSGLKRINVLKLPDEDSVLLAKGDLEAGTYKNLRLQFDSATIVLKNDLRVGAFDFQKATPYTLRVPSGIIKVPLTSFTVGADSTSTLNMEFRNQPSIANIVATGNGVLQMTPVLHVK